MHFLQIGNGMLDQLNHANMHQKILPEDMLLCSSDRAYCMDKT